MRDMKKDITSTADIQLLVDSFYEKVRADEVIGYIFNDVVNVDWPRHLPKMYAFWSFLLLGQDSYTGNPMDAHRKVHQMVPLTEAHFDRWLLLFCTTVDEIFEGLVAEDAKNRARLIVLTWKPKFTS